MMKFIIAAPLLLFWCLPAVQSSNPSIVRKGQSDSTAQIKAQAPVTSMNEQDDYENEDEQDHRKLYTLPDWFGDIMDKFTGINLQRCYRRPDPPTDGDSCSKRAKTCYWGDQVCPDGSPYPTIECFCNGDGVSKGTWSCIDPLPCPVDSTSSPSAGPTIEELSTTPTVDSTSSPSAGPTIEELSTTPTPIADLGSISGNVKADDNGDDIGDFNLPGVPIRLLDSSGNLVATTETDANGNYVFYDLPASGSYSVVETNIAAFPLDVSDIDGDDENSIGPVTIGVGNPVNSTGNDFVDCPSRTISGQVLLDTDNDNVGDTPIPGDLVSVLDVNGVTVATTITDANGEFSFEVPKGVYNVLSTNGLDDVSDSDGGDPNAILTDVTSTDSLNLVFVDDIP